MGKIKVKISTTEDSDWYEFRDYLIKRIGKFKIKSGKLFDIEFKYQFKNEEDFYNFAESLKQFKCFFQCNAEF